MVILTKTRYHVKWQISIFKKYIYIYIYHPAFVICIFNPKSFGVIRIRWLPIMCDSIVNKFVLPFHLLMPYMHSMRSHNARLPYRGWFDGQLHFGSQVWKLSEGEINWRRFFFFQVFRYCIHFACALIIIQNLRFKYFLTLKTTVLVDLDSCRVVHSIGVCDIY